MGDVLRAAFRIGCGTRRACGSGVDNRTIKAFFARGWLAVTGTWLAAGEAVRALFGNQGYVQVETCRDYGDNERLTLGCLPLQE
jgi:methylase of polypeptide subunit release factors